MNTDSKNQLSELVTSEFKKYTENKLYLSNFATGSGKSYSIAELTCKFYPKQFGQIVILCVQRKLITSMIGELEKFYDDPESSVREEDVLIAESNVDLLIKAIKNGRLEDLVSSFEYYLENQSKPKAVGCLVELKKGVEEAKREVLNAKDSDYLTDKTEFQKLEGNIRSNVKRFIGAQKKSLQDKDQILKAFPILKIVYPQVCIKKAKVVLMTVHKALRGIDPIIDKTLTLTGFDNQKKGTLFIFDESDQGGMSMRQVLTEMALDDKKKYDVFKNYLMFERLLGVKMLSDDFSQKKLLLSNLSKAADTVSGRFKDKLGVKTLPNDILLDNVEEFEDSRNGVFLCGPNFRYEIKKDKAAQHTIGVKNKTSHLQLYTKESTNKGKRLSLSSFIELLNSNTKTIKASITNVVKVLKKAQLEEFKSAQKTSRAESVPFPTDENSVHTVANRLLNNEIEQQLLDFMTNPKSIKTDEGIKIEDPSVYMQGLQLYYETVDDQDFIKNVGLYCEEVLTTPEKLILQLLNKEKNTVVLSSATANSRSVISNFSIQYLKSVLRKRVVETDEATHRKFEELLNDLYHKDYQVKTMELSNYKYDDSRIDKWELHEKYRNLFDKKALDLGLDKQWFRCTKALLKNAVSGRPEKQRMKGMLFELNRLFKFMEVYFQFWNHEDIHSMIYFQNKSGMESIDKSQIMCIAGLIDGSFDFEEIQVELPDFEDENVLVSNDTNAVKRRITETIGKDSRQKLMLVTAYNSFKAGENLQYEYAEGTHVLLGNSWDGGKEKDWDAVYLQQPTNYYRTSSVENVLNTEVQKFLSMLSCMMFMDDGKINRKQAYQILNSILKQSDLYLSVDEIPGLRKDKANWMLTILEQSVGRLCRTKTKNETTYIFYDTDIRKCFKFYDKKKSYTKEFRQLITDISENQESDSLEDFETEKSLMVNNANLANRELNQVNTKALWYNIHVDDIEQEYDSDDDENTSYKSAPNVTGYQKVIDDFKEIILKNPVIDDIESIGENHHGINIERCYGKWRKDDSREGYDYWRCEKEICEKTSNAELCHISPSSVRLDVMMRNSVIKQYFDCHGYATKWDSGKSYILHPDILQSWYAGEIGEQAFKAIVSSLFNVKLEKLTDRDYELADFVIKDKEGKNLVAFDVKNYDPAIEHIDNVNDIDTPTKRREKTKRLGCKLVVVNIVEIPGHKASSNEIGGLITTNGDFIPGNVEVLKQLINNTDK